MPDGALVGAEHRACSQIHQNQLSVSVRCQNSFIGVIENGTDLLRTEAFGILKLVKIDRPLHGRSNGAFPRVEENTVDSIADCALNFVLTAEHDFYAELLCLLNGLR